MRNLAQAIAADVLQVEKRDRDPISYARDDPRHTQRRRYGNCARIPEREVIPEHERDIHIAGDAERQENRLDLRYVLRPIPHKYEHVDDQEKLEEPEEQLFAERLLKVGREEVVNQSFHHSASSPSAIVASSPSRSINGRAVT